jgi:hypothetical protein
MRAAAPVKARETAGAETATYGRGEAADGNSAAAQRIDSAATCRYSEHPMPVMTTSFAPFY